MLLVYVLEKLHNCMFFDKDIQTSIFFPTLHDAVLHVINKQKVEQRNSRVVRKAYIQVPDYLQDRSPICFPNNKYIAIVVIT